MGKKWDYNVPSVEIWKECLRVLKPGGYLLSFAGTRTQHRMAVNIEDAGFEIRDMIAWVYGSGFPKSLNVGKAIDKIQGNEREVVGEKLLWGHNAGTGAGSFSKNKFEGQTGITRSEPLTKGESYWEGYGTALKPAMEPVTVARKPIIGTVANNVLKYGTGGLNIDGCRVPINPEVDDKRLGGNGTWKTDKCAKNVYEGGYVGTDQGSSPQGRFPANIIHDGSPEVLAVFPNTKSGRSNGNAKIGEQGTNIPLRRGKVTSRDDDGSASRFFYCAKTSKSERNKGCEELVKKDNLDYEIDPEHPYKSGHRNDNNANQLYMGITGKPPTKQHNHHPTVKPLKLMRYLCKLVTPPHKSLILDPFCGSGSTGIAVVESGHKFMGIELDADYCEIAKCRIFGN